jgi:hypothetical protein
VEVVDTTPRQPNDRRIDHLAEAANQDHVGAPLGCAPPKPVHLDLARINRNAKAKRRFDGGGLHLQALFGIKKSPAALLRADPSPCVHRVVGYQADQIYLPGATALERDQGLHGMKARRHAGEDQNAQTAMAFGRAFVGGGQNQFAPAGIIVGEEAPSWPVVGQPSVQPRVLFHFAHDGPLSESVPVSSRQQRVALTLQLSH